MRGRSLIGPVALIAALMAAPVGARALDDTKHPDWAGQWQRVGGIQWDPSKPLGRGQQPPLTPEYQAVFEASLADQARGGQGNWSPCLPAGMPRLMTAVFPMEIIILPNITYILFEQNLPRRIYTDGRAWPNNIEPTFSGYSIGKWVDDDRDGRYDALEVETRNMKGSRAFEISGLPLHQDKETVVKERIGIDKADRDILLDEITTIDHALTHPWTVTKKYHRRANPVWLEYDCADDQHVAIGKENYLLSADGLLMPTKKNQAPPDLKYFSQSRK